MENSLTSLYSEIENHEELELQVLRMNSRRALVRPDGLICVDYSQIKTTAQEKETLMEEIAHYETHAFYPVQANTLLWEKMEYRARTKMFLKYFPPEQIALLMAHGYVQPHELAEQLEMDIEFVIEMLQYYTQVKGIDFSNFINIDNIELSEKNLPIEDILPTGVIDIGAFSAEKISEMQQMANQTNDIYQNGNTELNDFLQEIENNDILPIHFCLASDVTKAQLQEAYVQVLKIIATEGLY